jgi:hypothetical protein
VKRGEIRDGKAGSVVKKKHMKNQINTPASQTGIPEKQNGYAEAGKPEQESSGEPEWQDGGRRDILTWEQVRTWAHAHGKDIGLPPQEDSAYWPQLAGMLLSVIQTTLNHQHQADMYRNEIIAANRE